MVCPICNASLGDEAKFCKNCGRRIPRCPSCGKVLDKRKKFCGNDGTKIPESILALLDGDAQGTPAQAAQSAAPSPRRAEGAPKVPTLDSMLEPTARLEPESVIEPEPKPAPEPAAKFDAVPEDGTEDEAVDINVDDFTAFGSDTVYSVRSHNRVSAGAEQTAFGTDTVYSEKSHNRLSERQNGGGMGAGAAENASPRGPARFCTKCGRPSDNGQPVCSQCARRFGAKNGNPAARTESRGTVQAKRKKSGALKYVLLGFAALLLLLAAAGAAFYFIDGEIPFVSEWIDGLSAKHGDDADREEDDADEEKAEDEEKDGRETLPQTAAAPSASTPKGGNLTFTTGGDQGTYYGFGTVLAGKVSDKTNTSVTAITSGGSKANI
ncbi:MAG: zinc ribbon domain-containing protein, partial [Oscillospiraceae bacterium]|nr:zinc ribbon domain-containing protein [Oscillospiraceae bacterium]